MRAAKIPFQQHHATARLAQEKRSGSPDNAAANDHCIDFDHG
jgi:hypothetical protein